jgi:hypothetical protein
MRRKLFTLAAAVSAVLFVAVGTLWVRSYRVFNAHWLGWGCSSGAGTSSGYIVTGQNWPGGMWFAVESVRNADPAWWQWMHNADGTGLFVDSNTLRYSGWRKTHRPAFTAGRNEKTPWRLRYGGQAAGWVERSVGAPHWFLLLLTVPLPLAWAGATRSRRRRRRRARQGLCLRCGYDLRSTPDRCPECGAVPTPKGAQA